MQSIPNSAAFYGLEDHLKQCAEGDEAYKHLWGRWIADKDEYKACLEATLLSNPGYSQHDASHSARIISAIEKVLGVNSIRKLSPTDAWLFLECAYSHDVGMAVPADKLFENWMNDTKFDDWIEKEVLNDRALLEQYDFIYPLLEKLRDFKDNNQNEKREEPAHFRYTKRDKTQLYAIYKNIGNAWPIKFRNAVNSLAQAYERKHHSKRTQKIVLETLGGDSVIHRRLKNLIVAVNEFHGGKREELLRRFPKTTKGIGNDDAHPRFIAALIRIGDLLDLDSNRFNKYIISVTGNVDRHSLVHQIKHNGVTEFDIQPSKISVKAEYSKSETEKYISTLPKSTKEYKPEELTIEAVKAMHEWLSWLDEEIKHFKIFHNEIIPRDIYSSLPSFSGRVLHEGNETKPDEIQLAYKSDPRRSAELIEGTDVYKRAGLVFLRELIQNAVDASKRQLFRDIRMGLYNHTIKFTEIDEKPDNTYGFENLAPLKKIDLLEMLKRLGEAVQGYSVEVSITRANPNICEKTKSCNNNKSAQNDTAYGSKGSSKSSIEHEEYEDIKIIVRDRGIGISMDNLRNMRHIGNIFDIDLNEMRRHMPKWLRPTGSFGFGMQSVFRNVRKFELKTVRQTENQKLEGIRATFYSSRMGGEIYPQAMSDKEAESFGRGTSVEVTLSKDDAGMFIQSAYRYGSNRYGSYDKFSSSFDLIAQIAQEYVNETCTYIGFPIVFAQISGTESGQLIKSTDSMLCELYGDYVITRDEKNEPKVIEIKNRGLSSTVHDDSSAIEFSYWDKERIILVKYSFIRNNGYESNPFASTNKVFFKGILVDDEWVCSKIALPGGGSYSGAVSISAHLLGKEADNYLTISRDAFLPEPALEVTKDIQQVNLDCMEDIFKIISLTSLSDDANNPYENHNTTYSFCETIAGDLQFMRLLASMTLYMPEKEIPDELGVKALRKDILSKKKVYIITGERSGESYGYISTDTGVFPSDPLWYINEEKFIPPQSVSLRDCSIGNDNSIIATADLFSNYSDHLAISKLELFVPHWGQGDYEQIYTLNPRRAEVVDMDEKYFWKYLVSLLKMSKKTSGRGHARILLPGIQKYKKLVVHTVPDELLSRENHRFMSWIIVPFTVEAFDESKQTKEKPLLTKYLETPEGHDLVRWVAKHSLMNSSDSRITEKEVTIAYQSWLDDFLSENVE